MARTKKIGNTIYTIETMQERFDRYGEQEKTLKLLCQPLNVDIELSDDDISEMQTKITDLESELDGLKTDHEALKESVEQNNESIADFKAWLSSKFEENDYTSIEVCIDDILHEYKKTIPTIYI